MDAQTAFDQLKPQDWAKTSVDTRLALISEIQSNLKKYAKELGDTDARMKNGLLGEDFVTTAEGMGTTVNPIGMTLKGIQRLYESLAQGLMPKPLSVKPLDNNRYQVEVYPVYQKDKLVAAKQKGYLHIEGTPKQVSPFDKPAGIIAVAGAGNYSSSIEMVMALFLENKAVIHKPHQLNEATDRVWKKVFAPLLECNAVAFINADQGQAMSALKGLDAIYFTGSTGVAHGIQDAASAPLVSECGGNNPCLIVPGDRPWTDKELAHHAVMIVSAGKLNGGAICGRMQTIITSKNWPQRQAFLDALRKAVVEDTFATWTYYPGVDKTKAAFTLNQLTAEVLQPEKGKYASSDVLFIPDVGTDDYAIHNEAFCQIFSEVPLGTENNATDFLDKATEFCNEQLLGSLGCMILVDDDTFKTHDARVHQAVNELNYGGIAVNNIPPNIWLNPYLTWGGCGETTENFVSGVGNFGNAFNFENIVKSVIIDKFGADAFALTHRKQFENLLVNASFFAVDQSWGQFFKLAVQMIRDSFRKKDF